VIALILVAAGSGQRLGAGVPKALVEVAGDTLIGHSLRVAEQIPEIADTVVVVPPAQTERVRTAAPSVRVVPGGATRDESVRAGLDALVTGTEHVLIHDAARPFTPPEVYRRVVSALRGGAVAVIPGVPVADTIKQVREGIVVRTVDRSDLVAVQTPQGFTVDLLRQAHADQRTAVTDDAMLMENAGHHVHVVAGSHHAFKITTPFDLAVARAMKGS
jgi:2-C-methyl-D-erythritol 4-phosphate cytidylyltransferase